MSEAERPTEAAEKNEQTTAPTTPSSTKDRSYFQLADEGPGGWESRGYDPYDANTSGRRPDVWRYHRKRA